MCQRYVGEIAEDRTGARLLHGEGVMRGLPALGLRRMAWSASRCSDEYGRRISWRFRLRRVETQQTCERHDDGNYGRAPDEEHGTIPKAPAVTDRELLLPKFVGVGGKTKDFDSQSLPASSPICHGA